MRWKLGQFEFDQDTNVLSHGNIDTLLEPKTSALLTYFIQNSQKNISRDELMEHVWGGQIISENAINRVVVRLRKALGDDDKVKTFIVTVPKTGYRFVVQAEPFEKQTTQKTSSKGIPAVPVSIAAVAALVAASWLGTTLIRPDARQNNANVSPLIRLSGEQFDGALAHTSDRMVYSHYQSSNTPLYLAGTTDTAPQIISSEKGVSKNAFWLPDDSAVIYQHISGRNCEFHIIEFQQDQPQEPEVFYNCRLQSEASFASSKDGQLIYFTERENEFAPYSVFEFDRKTSDKRQIPQPTASGLGNYHIDKHPNTSALLILSAEAPGQTSAFEINTSTGSFQKIYEFDYRVDYAVWGHKENTLVHMGEHPSYQLVDTNFETNETVVLVKDSRRITEPKRANNGKDYYFRSFLTNRDIAVNGKTQDDLNSSVRDYLPVFSHDGNKLAFISKRAGYSQVWIRDYQNNLLFPIEVKDRGRIYRQLAWSPDNQKLAANTDAGIILIDIESRQTGQTIKFALPTYAVSWEDNNKLSYSHFNDGRWDHYEYDPLVNVSTPHDKTWAFSIKSTGSVFYFDQQMKLHDVSGEIIDTSLCASPVIRSTLTYQLIGEKLTCLAKRNDSQPQLLQMQGGAFEAFLSLPPTSGTSYSISNDKVAVSVLSSSTSDIMRTNIE
ncbi:MAG: winged helix-turn-helix domain-containing protein [Kordiimonas sp.]